MRHHLPTLLGQEIRCSFRLHILSVQIPCNFTPLFSVHCGQWFFWFLFVSNTSVVTGPDAIRTACCTERSSSENKTVKLIWSSLMDMNESSKACQVFHELCGVIKNMLPMRLETPSFLPCGLGYICCTGMLEIARCVSLGTLIRMSMFMNWLNLTSLQAICVLSVLNCPFFWWFRHHYYYWLLADCILVMRSRFSGIMKEVAVQ